MEVPLSLGLCYVFCFLFCSDPHYVNYLINKPCKVRLTTLSDHQRVTRQDLLWAFLMMCFLFMVQMVPGSFSPPAISLKNAVVLTSGKTSDKWRAAKTAVAFGLWRPCCGNREVNGMNHHVQLNAYNVIFVILLKYVKVKLYICVLPGNKGVSDFINATASDNPLGTCFRRFFICILCIAITVQTLKISYYQDSLN